MNFQPITGITQQINPVQLLSQAGGITDFDASESKKASNKYSFTNVMLAQVHGVGNTLREAGRQNDLLIKGEVKNPHDVAISGHKAGIMLKLSTVVCSKLATACTTLFQMQI